MADIRIYFLPYEDNWNRLTLSGVPPVGESDGPAAVRQAIFMNPVLMNINHLKLRPGDIAPVLQSMLVHFADGGSLVGIGNTNGEFNDNHHEGLPASTERRHQ